MFKAPPRGPFCYSTRSGGSPQLLRTKARREPAKGRKSHLGQNLVVGVFPMVSAPARLPPTKLGEFPSISAKIHREFKIRGSLRKENSCLKPPQEGLFATVLGPAGARNYYEPKSGPYGYFAQKAIPARTFPQESPPMVSGVAPALI